MLFMLPLRLKGLLCIILSVLNSYFINKYLIYFSKKKHYFTSQREEIKDNIKSKTPIFGGISFALSILITLIIVDYNVFLEKQILVLIFVSLIFFFVGFIDDYLKVFKHNYKGLNALIRTLIELFAIFIFIKYFYIDNFNSLVFHIDSKKSLYLGNMIFIVVPLILYGGTNSINLTDGMDGLLSYLYLFSLLPLIYICLISKSYYLLFYIFSLYGSIISFMRFNLKPAKIFMGDTGSLYLGINYLLLSFLLRVEYLIPISSFIYILEALSVIIQVFSFQVFHKRVFKMCPLHHHFALIGIKEWKIVFMFSLIGLFSLILSLGLII